MIEKARFFKENGDEDEDDEEFVVYCCDINSIADVTGRRHGNTGRHSC